MGRLTRAIPDWVRFRVPGGPEYAAVKRVVGELKLHTICTEARCPNIGECLCEGTATFLILGNVCTRNCRYCAVKQGVPAPPEDDEPERVGRAVSLLKLSYAVITSVTRDDLPDGGASAFARTIDAIRAQAPGAKIETLIPDFLRSAPGSLETVFRAGPDVLNHNIEVARPLFEKLRPLGNYRHSLRLLEKASAAGLPAKSGLMAGFGETMDDIAATLHDLRAAGCSILTVGQYLRSHKGAFPVAKYYTPGEFAEMQETALEMGFSRAKCGPLVRSSYRAAESAL
jgi:lipoic acid synthetase